MSIKFKMAIRCESAGRSYNEDNWQLSDNLSNGNWAFTTDALITLDEKGALLVVCDGMGGMNAGEVASASAIQTIKEWFAPDKLTKQIIESSDSILHYIEKTIVAADTQIKEEGKKDKAKEGMGSTIVLAWIIEKKLYIGWCGDSRIYRFNPVSGLKQISHDHSYVQELVDAGKLTQELAFDHPDSNIITHSLGDPRQKARPDVKYFQLYDNDIIMLCSDGLSGVLRDPEMEAIIAKNTGSMEGCRNALWNASEKAGWQDNVTVALCQIVSGANVIATTKTNQPIIPEKTDGPQKKGKGKISLVILAILIVMFGTFEVGYRLGKGKWWIPALPENKCECSKEKLITKIDALKEKYREVDNRSTYSETIKSVHESLERLRQLENMSDSICNKYDSLENNLKKKFTEWAKELNSIINISGNTNINQIKIDLKLDSIIPIDIEKSIFEDRDNNQDNNKQNNKQIGHKKDCIKTDECESRLTLVPDKNQLEEGSNQDIN